MRAFLNRFTIVGVAGLVLGVIVLGNANGQQPATAVESTGQSSAGGIPASSQTATAYSPTAASSEPLDLTRRRSSKDEQSARLLQQEGELETKIQEAVHQFATLTDETARTQMRADIARLLEQQFELRQNRHEQTVQKLEERVRLLRAALQKRENARQKMVDGRLNVLLEEAEGLGWGDFNGAQPLSTQGQYGRPQSGRR
jgi:uncharacterized membrane protein YccC